jgi:NitT/TauT family transport system substrate-binding protein
VLRNGSSAPGPAGVAVGDTERSYMKALLRGVVSVAAAIAFTGTVEAQGLTKIRFTTDWKIQGGHAWYYLASEKGYFRDAGLDVTVDQGEGSAAAIGRVLSGAYDAGFGDINAVIQNAADRPGQQPVMVYLLYNRAPYAIIAKADGPIKSLKDLEGHTVSAPAGSATLRMFAPLAKLVGVDAGKVKILNAAPNLIEQILVTGQADAIAQFSATSYMNFIAMHLDPEKDFRWFFYSDFGLDLYSNGVVVSQKLLHENPQAVAGLVKAINRAVLDVVAHPDAGITLIRHLEPLINADIEGKRQAYFIDQQMLTPETERLGIGDLDDKRLGASIKVVADAYGLKRVPELREVFVRDFLPPKAERDIKAAAGK